MGWHHLKSWLVETSADGEIWREVAREENNKQLNGSYFAGTFAVGDDRERRFIRLVNIGRNHIGSDHLQISAWEIFGTLIDETANSSDGPFAFRSQEQWEPMRTRRAPSVAADSSFQLSLGSCGVTGTSVPILQ
jgi:hypothetical protein